MSSSLTAYFSPLLDVGRVGRPSYLHLVCYWASYTTFTPIRGLQSRIRLPQRLYIWPLIATSVCYRYVGNFHSYAIDFVSFTISQRNIEYRNGSALSVNVSAK